jgi:hypothetical protein
MSIGACWGQSGYRADTLVGVIPNLGGSMSMGVLAESPLSHLVGVPGGCAPGSRPSSG